MDAAGHYREAEKLIEDGAGLRPGENAVGAARRIAVAQVHATLALAAPHHPDSGEKTTRVPPETSTTEETTEELLRRGARLGREKYA
jgi:hypothetical protein